MKIPKTILIPLAVTCGVIICTWIMASYAARLTAFAAIESRVHVPIHYRDFPIRFTTAHDWGITVNSGIARKLIPGRFQPEILPGEEVSFIDIIPVRPGERRSINEIFIDHVIRFGELEGLGLRSCGMNDRIAEHLVKLRHLKYLSVADNNLTDKTLKKILKMQELKVLRCEDTEFKFAFIERVELLAPLESLLADRSRCGNEAVATINRFDRLCELGLSGTELDERGLSQLKLPKLEYLWISSLRISDASGIDFSEMPLKFLDLSKTACDDSMVECLLTCQKLDWLSINHTDMTTSGLLRLIHQLRVDTLLAMTIPCDKSDLLDALSTCRIRKVYLPGEMHADLMSIESEIALLGWLLFKRGDSVLLQRQGGWSE